MFGLQGGDLMTALGMDKGRQMGWYNKGKNISVDIARGLAFLHSSRVIHRDLKSKNVLLTRVRVQDTVMTRYILVEPAATPSVHCTR